jgi:hypothetical protein
MKKVITDERFKEASKIFLPEYIKIDDVPYVLVPHLLLAGGYCIMYFNEYLDSKNRVAFNEIWDNPLDCIKVMSHRFERSIGAWKISKEQYDELIQKFTLDKSDKI